MNILSTPSKVMVKKAALFITAGLSVAILAACSPTTTPEDNGQTQAQVQAVPVQVASVLTSQISESHEFTGRTQAPETVELRPRVSGYIDSVQFTEGSIVDAGEVLFTVDSASFEAEVQRLTAELTMAEDSLALANKELQRAQQLSKSAAISREVLDTRVSNQRQASARIEAVNAALASAQLQLDYTQIKAPISGKVSSAIITKGNFVSAGESLLTRIVSTNKIHAYFDADEKTYLNYADTTKTNQKAPILMGLANQSDMPYSGHIDFVDNQVNPSTGTIRARAIFDNEEGQLIPGLFTRIQVIGSQSYQGVLIDDKAIGTDLNNRFVLVVGDDNIVEYRKVVLGKKLAGLRIIKEGLNGNEQIVVNGLQRIRPGALIQAQITDMASAETLASLNKHSERIARLIDTTNDTVAALR